jgi:hypothetical protein
MDVDRYELFHCIRFDRQREPRIVGRPHGAVGERDVAAAVAGRRRRSSVGSAAAVRTLEALDAVETERPLERRAAVVTDVGVVGVARGVLAAVTFFAGERLHASGSRPAYVKL